MLFRSWGPIFMADNMSVTPAPPPILLSQAAMLASGAFQFAFTNTPGAIFTVLAATNPAVPFANWNVLRRGHRSLARLVPVH